MRYLAFVVVQAVMRARGNAGADGNGGFDCQRSKCSGARIRMFWKLGRQNARRFIGRASFNGAASSALTGATRHRIALLRSLGRWVGTD